MKNLIALVLHGTKDTRFKALRESVEQVEADRAWRTNFGDRAEALRKACQQAKDALAADPGDHTVNAYLEASEAARQADDLGAVRVAVGNTLTQRGIARLKPDLKVALEALLELLAEKRAKVAADDKALADSHGIDEDDATSPVRRKIDQTANEATAILDRLPGEQNLANLMTASRWCLGEAGR